MKYDNIPGFPGYYISKHGILWSRYVNGNNILGSTWRKKRFSPRTNGRMKTCIVHEKLGKIKMNRYRLVALAWVPNPDNKPEVCHKDNNPINDDYKNLYWGTHKENMHQMSLDNRATKVCGKYHPFYQKRGWSLSQCKVTKDQFLGILSLIDSGKQNKYIIEKLKLNIHSAAISRIRKRYLEGYYKCLFT